MSEQQVKSALKELSEKKVPKSTIDLWPGLESRIVKEGDQKREIILKREPSIHSNQNRNPRLRIAATFTLVALLVVGLFFISPQGKGLAQNILRFFTKSESNQLPLQDFQKTPLSTSINSTPEPSSIIFADKSISDVQQQAGYDVFVPMWIPKTLSFSGASFDKENNSVYIFYRFYETNGLVFKQEFIPETDTCPLCNQVGADAEIQIVSINGVYGEYAEGVWKLTENGEIWESDPWLKTLRWQAGGMAFELLYMGPPESLSLEELIEIAEGIEKK